MKVNGLQIYIKIKVIPKSSKNEILNVTDGLLRIKVTAAPVKGAPNEAVIKLLAKEWGLKKSQIAIVNGKSQRLKLLN